MKIVESLRSQINQIRSFSRPARLYLIAVLIDGISYCGWSLFLTFTSWGAVLIKTSSAWLILCLP